MNELKVPENFCSLIVSNGESIAACMHTLYLIVYKFSEQSLAAEPGTYPHFSKLCKLNKYNVTKQIIIIILCFYIEVNEKSTRDLLILTKSLMQSNYIAFNQSLSVNRF